MINYKSVCKTLESFMLDLLEKGLRVPEQIFEGLTLTRNLMLAYEKNPQGLDLELENSSVLKTVEMNLLITAEAAFGKEYADAWSAKIMAAYREEYVAPVKIASFVSGIPKGDHFIRLNVKDFPLDKEAEKLAVKHKLTTRQQEDGYLLIHGSKEGVKTLIEYLKQVEILKRQG